MYPACIGKFLCDVKMLTRQIYQAKAPISSARWAGCAGCAGLGRFNAKFPVSSFKQTRNPQCNRGAFA
jgi:hypothetical protein